MDRVKHRKLIKSSLNNCNHQTITIPCSLLSTKERNRKYYDLSSKSRLIIVDGNLKNQERALEELRKEMAEIVRAISEADSEKKQREEETQTKFPNYICPVIK